MLKVWCQKGSLYLSLVMGCLSVLACQLNTSHSASSIVVEPEMISFKAGGLALLGKDDSLLSSWEHPQTYVHLSYSFALGKHEVTQKEFLNVMGFNPVTDAFLKGDEKPVVNISWYDAILFCNALSNALGLDSVYSYTTLEKSDESVMAIEGLIADFTQNGYRLPTEAEWNLAAGSLTQKYPWGNDTSKAQDYAIYTENSIGRLAGVCRKELTGFGFCDLGGNAMEWVQDWLWDLPGDTVENYLGGLTAAFREGSKVVKGGAYLVGAWSMRLSNRRDVYQREPASNADYIGFRLARGVIPYGSYQSNSGSIDMSKNQISFQSSKEKVFRFFGTDRVKLAVVLPESDQMAVYQWQNVSLGASWVEYSSLRHPEWSPEGKRIAFGTRSEGQSKGGKLLLWDGRRLCDSLETPLGMIPRWHVNGSDTEIIFVDHAYSNQNLSEWSSNTHAYRVGVHWRSFTSLAEKLDIPGGFHSGFTSDLTYWTSGYTQLRTYDQKENTIRTLFQSPHNGKAASESDQVCNVSLAPDTSKNILFIDFGSNQSSSIVNRPYGVHEILFRMHGPSDSVLDIYNAPEEYEGWNYPEYSNHPNFAVATATDASGMNPVVYAIRLSDGETLPLAWGKDLWMPSLWLDSALILSESWPSSLDSIGRYDLPGDNSNRGRLNHKMHLMWRYKDSIRVVALGTSRMDNGFYPDFFEDGLSILNLGFAGSDVRTSLQLLQTYIIPNVSKLDEVILDLGPEFIASTLNWGVLVEPSLGFLYDYKRNFYRKEPMTALETKLMELNRLYFADTSATLWHGASIYPDCNGWGAEDYFIDTQWDNQDNWVQTLAELESVLSILQDKKIRLLGVLFPQNPKYAGGDYYGRHGLPMEQVDEVFAALNSIQQRYPDVFKWIDLNQNGEHGLDDNMASNTDHLCVRGSIWATRRMEEAFAQW